MYTQFWCKYNIFCCDSKHSWPEHIHRHYGSLCFLNNFLVEMKSCTFHWHSYLVRSSGGHLDLQQTRNSWPFWHERCTFFLLKHSSECHISSCHLSPMENSFVQAYLKHPRQRQDYEFSSWSSVSPSGLRLDDLRAFTFAVIALK